MFLVVMVVAVLSLCLVGCSKNCDCSCSCDNCTCNGGSAKAAATASGSAAVEQSEAASFKAAIASDTPASDDGMYSGPTSSCSITAVEPYVKGGKEYVKVTQTMTVTESPSHGDRLISYTPKAFQNNIAINEDSSLEDVNNRSQEVIAGGSISTDYYYPAGDYSDILITYGYDGESIGKHQGQAVIHIEKN